MVGWIGIALLFSYVFTTKSYKANSSYGIKLKRIIISVVITLFAGLFSVFTRGIPDIGFSVNSFIYALFASLCLVFYQQAKRRIFDLNLAKIRRKPIIKDIEEGNVSSPFLV